MREQEEWEKLYAPIDLQGKTVLDCGAGEGESARFYLGKGAKTVYCIEPDDDAFRLLKKNASLHPGIVPIQKCFELSDLQRNFDFMKMDIEGYEEVLLVAPDLPFPALVEVHSIPERLRFEDRGWKTYFQNFNVSKGFGAVCYVYWGCYP